MKLKSAHTFIKLSITLLLTICVLLVGTWIAAFELKANVQFQQLIPYWIISGLSELFIASLYIIYFWVFTYRTRASNLAAIFAIAVGLSLLSYNILAHQSNSLNMSSHLLPEAPLFTTGAFIFATGGFNLLRQRFSIGLD
jgi:hypothetical protein